jgi:serine/threonine protein kinase
MSEPGPTGDFGDFERLEGPPLGSGATGRVYRARQKSLRRPAALKVIDRLTSDPEDIPHLDARFQREILALGQIKHPNVVAIYAAGVADGKPWTAMECLEGGTLDSEIARRIREKRWFSDGEIARIGSAAAAGLAAALDRGIIHRDLKPSNILFDRDGRPVVTDFGMAKLRGAESEGLERLTGSKDVLGTPAFMSPEQILPPGNGPVDHRADIYSLGAVLYNMATLVPPFSGKSPYDVMNKHVMEEPASIRSINPGCSAELEAIILRCLSKDRAKRPQTYADLLADLENIRQTPPTRASATASGRRTRRAAGAVILLVAGLAVIVSTGQLRSKVPKSEYGGSTSAGPPPSSAPPSPAVKADDDAKSDGKKDDASTARADHSSDAKDKESPAPPKEPPEPLRTTLTNQAALQPAELVLVRELRERFRSRHQELSNRTFDSLIGDLESLAKDDRQTAYTRRLLDGARNIVGGARDAVATRLRTLMTPSSIVTVRLKDGASVAGTVSASDRDSVTVSTGDGKTVRILFADLAPEDFTSGNPVPLPVIALRGLSDQAATVLHEALELSTEKEDLLLWLPCLAWIALEDGRTLGRSGDLAGAKVSFQAMTAVKEDLVPLFSILGETFDSVRSESEAIDRFERKVWSEVLAGFPGTCVFAAAEKEFWESLRREATEDLILRSRGQLEWQPHPKIKDGKELLRFWDQKTDADGKESTFLQGSPEIRSIVRNEPTPQAGDGLLMILRFTRAKDAEDGCFQVTLNPTAEGSNYLRMDGETVSLVHDQTRPEQKREAIASGPIPPSEAGATWRQLALIPSGGRLFVLVDGKLITHAEKVSIPSIFAIGVCRGDLALRSVLVKPTTKDK